MERLQRSHSYTEAIQDIGCEHLCCAAMVEDYTGESIPTLAINHVWANGIECGVISPTAGLDQWDSYKWVLEELFASVGCEDMTGDQVGSQKRGIVSFWSWYELTEFRYRIRKWRLSTGAEHAQLLDPWGRLIYDPLPGLPKTAIIIDKLYMVDSHQTWNRAAARMGQASGDVQ